MSYTAMVNGTVFFKTDSDDMALALTAANVKLGAGSAGTFTFTVPPSNSKFQKFARFKNYIDVYRDGEEDPLFSGRVVTISSDFNMLETINCEGALTYFSDSTFSPVTFDGRLHSLVLQLVNAHNSQVETDKEFYIGNIEVSNDICYRAYEKMESTLSRLQDLVDSYGGYLQARKHDNKLYLDWHAAYSGTNDQIIRLGSNLLDITVDDDDDSICTVLIPYGAQDDDGNYLTIESVNSGSDRITASQEYLNKYGYITRIEYWDDVTVAANLLAKAQVSLLDRLTPKITIKANAVDLADTNEVDVDYFSIGQTLAVYSPIHGVDDYFECKEQDLNLLAPDDNVLTLGAVKESYIKIHSSVNTEALISKLTNKFASKRAMDEAIDNATTRITGNDGGYIITYDSNDDGKPDEFIVADTDDYTRLFTSNTVKLWRFNKNGLGYSSTGYNGQYGLAMTMDGSIVADRITTGIIRGGDSFWNLETGDAVFTGDIVAKSLTLYPDVYLAAAKVSGLSSVATSGSYSDLSNKPTIPSLTGYIKTDGTIGSTPASGATGFKVSSAGLLQASNAVIYGTIYASAGTIGGLQIETSSLHTNGVAITSNASGSIGFSSSNFTRSVYTKYGYGGSSSAESLTTLRLAIGSRFAVDTQGNVYCLSANMGTVRISGVWYFSYDNFRYTGGEYGNSGITIQNPRYQTTILNVHGYSSSYWSIRADNSKVESNADWYTTGSCAASSFPNSSDRRLKDNIETLNYWDSSDFIYSLRPVKFTFKSNNDVIRHGFIAQEVEPYIEDWGVIDEIETRDDKGDVLGVYKYINYTEFIADIVATLQTQNQRILELERRIS